MASLIQETSGHVSAIEIRQPPVRHRRSLTGCALNDSRKGKANGSSTSNHLPSGRTAPIGEPVPAQITSPPTYFTWQPPVARGLVASTANVLFSVERLSPGASLQKTRLRLPVPAGRRSRASAQARGYSDETHPMRQLLPSGVGEAETVGNECCRSFVQKSRSTQEDSAIGYWRQKTAPSVSQPTKVTA